MLGDMFMVDYLLKCMFKWPRMLNGALSVQT